MCECQCLWLRLLSHQQQFQQNLPSRPEKCSTSQLTSASLILPLFHFLLFAIPIPLSFSALLCVFQWLPPPLGVPLPRFCSFPAFTSLRSASATTTTATALYCMAEKQHNCSTTTVYTVVQQRSVQACATGGVHPRGRWCQLLVCQCVVGSLFVLVFSVSAVLSLSIPLASSFLFSAVLLLVCRPICV